MDKVVDHLLVFKGEGEIEDFPGNYSDYRSYEDSKLYVSKKEISDSKTWKEPAKNKLSYNEEKELKKIESKIKTLNYEKEKVEKEFLQEGLSQEKILLMSGELEKIITEIKKLKLKIQIKIQGEELRAEGKKRDDLQEAMSAISAIDIGLPIEFVNFRD